MSRIKIMFVLPNLAGGGAERVSLNFLNQLCQKKYDICLVVSIKEGSLTTLIPSNIKVYDLNTPRTMFSIFKLRNIISELSPDIVFSSLNRMNIALYLSMINIGKRRPYTIFRVPSSPKLVFKYNEMSKVVKLLLDFALNKADLVIAQTPEMKEEINIYHKVKNDKIKIVLNPLDTEEIDKNANETFDFFNKDQINIVASGRLRHEKGYDILIKAFAKVYQKNKNFKLYILGADYDGEQKKYESIIEELRIKDKVSFLGFQENPYKFYKNCDLFVLSSRREGLPNTVLENLYLQKPIVATTCIAFMTELIKNGKNGFLVPVEEVDGLAKAILNYKKIDPLYQTIKLNNKFIDNLFSIEKKELKL